MSDGWLNRRARSEAERIFITHGDPMDVCAAIEAVAREFADRAIAKMFETAQMAYGGECLTLIDPRGETTRNNRGELIGPSYFGGFVLQYGPDKYPLSAEDFVRRATTAADRDE